MMVGHQLFENLAGMAENLEKMLFYMLNMLVTFLVEVQK